MGRTEGRRAVVDYRDSPGTPQFKHVEATMMPNVASELTGKKVTVVGLARSGVSAAHLLHAVGADVTVADAKEEAKLAGALTHVDRRAIRVVVGPGYESAFDGAQLVVVSP